MARKTDVMRDGDETPAVLPYLAAMVLIVTTALAFTAGAVHLQTAAAAYISGESQWSRAQLSASFALYRYSGDGDPAHLRTARAGLDVLLGDRQARIAMEQAELDPEAVNDGFRRGGIHADDIPGMIRLFRWFSGAPWLRDAVAVWRESDSHVLELVAIADELEAEWAAGSPDDARIDDMRRRLGHINVALHGLAADFRTSLNAGSRWLGRTLTIASFVVMLLLAAGAVLIAHRMMAAIARSERRFRVIFERAGVGIARLDARGHWIDVNEALCRILRNPRAALLRRDSADLVHPDDIEHGEAEHLELMDGRRERCTVERRYQRGDGTVVWCRTTISSMPDAYGGTRSFIAIFEDVSEIRQLTAELSYKANHDALTGLLNRHSFERHLIEALREATIEAGQHALVYIDLDRFKGINDACGHHAGDEILRQIAALFRGQLREGDLLARIGGDEFALILERTTLDTAIRVAEKLRTAISDARFTRDEQTFHLGCSMGIVAITPDTVDVEAAMRAADTACYRAKEQGRNRLHVDAGEQSGATAGRRSARPG